MVDMKKHKLLVGLMSGLWLSTTWVFAESTYTDSDGLLDAYLEDEARTVTYPNRVANNQNVDVPDADAVTFIGDDGIKYRRVETVDGAEIYEAVPANAANTTSASDVTTLPEVVIPQQPEVKNSNGLEVIELEPVDGDYVEIEAPQSATIANVGNNAGQSSGHIYCQQNPGARECLLSEYVTRCEKDPQSTDCKIQLEKFDSFCATFPRSYKCKKAELAATCQKQPNLNQCKSFTERYCQKYPKAIFCNYN